MVAKGSDNRSAWIKSFKGQLIISQSLNKADKIDLDSLRIDPRRILLGGEAMEWNNEVIICSSDCFLFELAGSLPEHVGAEMIRHLCMG